MNNNVNLPKIVPNLVEATNKHNISYRAQMPVNTLAEKVLDKYLNSFDADKFDTTTVVTSEISNEPITMCSNCEAFNILKMKNTCRCRYINGIEFKFEHAENFMFDIIDTSIINTTLRLLTALVEQVIKIPVLTLNNYPSIIRVFVYSFASLLKIQARANVYSTRMGILSYMIYMFKIPLSHDLDENLAFDNLLHLVMAMLFIRINEYNKGLYITKCTDKCNSLFFGDVNYFRNLICFNLQTAARLTNCTETELLSLSRFRKWPHDTYVKVYTDFLLTKSLESYNNFVTFLINPNGYYDNIDSDIVIDNDLNNILFGNQ